MMYWIKKKKKQKEQNWEYVKVDVCQGLLTPLKVFQDVIVSSSEVYRGEGAKKAQIQLF